MEKLRWRRLIPITEEFCLQGVEEVTLSTLQVLLGSASMGLAPGQSSFLLLTFTSLKVTSREIFRQPEKKAVESLVDRGGEGDK